MIPPINYAVDQQAHYQVGFKILLKREGEFLFLKPPVGSCYDLPGGRILKSESSTPLIQIMQKNMLETLGPGLNYSLGGPLFQFRRFFKHLNLRVFFTVYEAKYTGGKIELSREYLSHHWINPQERFLSKKDFINLEEFSAFSDYFKKKKSYAHLSS